ncbi:hypothetical protein L7F22_040382 [Adiantum nelumboides]|nr:hypothetical protein [Adiantum nelumboides]
MPKTRPTYAQMCIEALFELSRRNGSSPHAIAKFLQARYYTPNTPSFRRRLLRGLKHLAHHQHLLLKIRASYKLSPTAQRRFLRCGGTTKSTLTLTSASTSSTTTTLKRSSHTTAISTQTSGFASDGSNGGLSSLLAGNESESEVSPATIMNLIAPPSSLMTSTTSTSTLVAASDTAASNSTSASRKRRRALLKQLLAVDMWQPSGLPVHLKISNMAANSLPLNRRRLRRYGAWLLRPINN